MYIPRWKAIADRFAADIRGGKLSEGEILPSETELSEQWHVSRMTAHRAMHELHQQGLVVRKRHVGTAVAPRRNVRLRRVAVFLHTHDFLEQSYLCGIRDGLPDETDLLFCDIRCDAQREADYLARMRGTVDGVLMIATCSPQNTLMLAQMLHEGVNIVCVDDVPADLDVSAVVSDNYGVSYDAISHLVKRGHRRIAHFTVDRPYQSSLRERYEGYQDALFEVGVLDNTRWLHRFSSEMVYDPASPRQAIVETLTSLMALPDRPTACFCVHDYMLSGVIQACQALGVSIPDDLEIVSFNDCPPIVPYLPNGVHRIVQRALEIGKAAAEQMSRHLGDEHATPEIVRIAPIFYPAMRSGHGEGPDHDI